MNIVLVHYLEVKVCLFSHDEFVSLFSLKVLLSAS